MDNAYKYVCVSIKMHDENKIITGPIKQNYHETTVKVLGTMSHFSKNV